MLRTSRGIGGIGTPRGVGMLGLSGGTGAVRGVGVSECIGRLAGKVGTQEPVGV